MELTAAKLAALGVLAALAIAGTIDAIIALRGAGSATVSQVITDLTREHPIIAFGAGLLAGHLFWPIRGR